MAEPVPVSYHHRLASHLRRGGLVYPSVQRIDRIRSVAVMSVCGLTTARNAMRVELCVSVLYRIGLLGPTPRLQLSDSQAP